MDLRDRSRRPARTGRGQWCDTDRSTADRDLDRHNEAHQLNAEQYQTFSLSVGTLPEAGTTVELPVTQSYADGTVRAWDEPTVEGEEEPGNPAPRWNFP